MKRINYVGAQLARAHTGASIQIYLLSNQMDESYKFCCAVIMLDSDGHFSSSRFMHSHLEMEEILEVLENPGNLGYG